MIDPKLMEQDDLGILAGMFAHGQFLHGSVNTLSKAGKEKFRTWAQKHYRNEIKELSQDVQACFASDVGDDEILAFLTACHAEMERRADQRRREYLDATASLDEDVRMALLAIYDLCELPPIDREGDCCTLLIDDMSAFRRKLILKNVEGISEYIPGGYMMDVPKLERTLERYIFSAKPDGEEFSVAFSQAEVQIECFNCVDSVVYWDDPWAYLRRLADWICYKAEAAEGHCNDLEKQLLPLLEEIRHLNGIWVEELEYAELKALAIELGFAKIAQALSKLEGLRGKKRLPACRKINGLLCRQKYEPLWRGIFEKIKESQSGYPQEAEVRCDGDVLLEKRSAVQMIMESHGFTGAYPDFELRGPIPGLHLECSYDQSFFVAGEKNAVSHIHCMEGCGPEGEPVIQYLCGIEFLKKGEEARDIYSCLFHAKGHRMFHWVRDHRLLDTPAEEPDLDEQLAKIAVKKARLQRLNRHEKKLYHIGSVPGWGLFWWYLLLGGGIFGALMTLGMMLIGVIVIILFGGFWDLPQILAEVPWGYFLLFCWGSFGLTMGVITVLATRK